MLPPVLWGQGELPPPPTHPARSLLKTSAWRREQSQWDHEVGEENRGRFYHSDSSCTQPAVLSPGWLQGRTYTAAAAFCLRPLAWLACPWGANPVFLGTPPPHHKILIVI